jgi:hypothetical protein
MANQYHMDLERFSLEQFKHILATQRLLPSESILREELPERFATLESMGIQNLADRTGALSTKAKLERFSQASGLPQDYLTMLRRRARSYTPRPIPLKKLPGIDPEHVDRLAALGIANTMQLFERAAYEGDRAELSRMADVPADAMLELVKLSDLARAPYVGPAFARLLYETGVDTIAKVSQQSSEALREKLVATNSERRLYRAAIPGVEDMASWLRSVRELPQVVEC